MSHDPNDALDHLLARPTAACDESLRRSLLAQTTNVLRLQRRGRQRRRIAFALAAAAILLAIAGVAIFPRSGTPERPVGPPNPTVVQSPAPLAADMPAAAIERIGETSALDQRSVLYRRAGDRYLEEAADPKDALRCYTQALDDGSEADLNVSADDSWLLMALKIDRKKEKKNANRD